MSRENISGSLGKKKPLIHLDKKMLTEKFEMPLAVVTYQGNLIATDVLGMKHPHRIDFETQHGPREVAKKEILMAFEAKHTRELSRLWHIDKTVAELKQTAIVRGWTRDNVVRLPMHEPIELTLRNGMSCSGGIPYRVDKYCFRLRIDQKLDILIFKHAVERMSVIEEVDKVFEM